MKLAVIVAIIVVLVLVAAAVAYFALQPRAPHFCPPVPPGTSAVGWWSTPDAPSAATRVSCPGSAVIAVQAAGYGAPWSACPWVDVTREAGAILNGKNSVEIPRTPAGPIGLPEACFGKVKTFAGAFACVEPTEPHP
jgi:hypothetical protein